MSNSSRLVILMYHRVLPEADPLRPDDITLPVFARCMRALKRYFNVLPLADAVEGLKAGSLPRRAVSITFDDGYADNATVAGPVLSELGLPATVFVSTGYLNGGRMWNDTVIETVRQITDSHVDFGPLGALPLGSDGDRLRAVNALLTYLKHLPFDERDRQVGILADSVRGTLDEHLMMTDAQVAGLADLGLAVGAHTVRHPILANLTNAESSDEISTSKSVLERMIGREVSLFAYPNGRPDRDYRRADVQAVVQAGFHAAVSTSWGSAGSESDLFQLPRIGPWDQSGWRLALRIEKARRFDRDAATAAE